MAAIASPHNQLLTRQPSSHYIPTKQGSIKESSSPYPEQPLHPFIYNSDFAFMSALRAINERERSVLSSPFLCETVQAGTHTVKIEAISGDRMRDPDNWNTVSNLSTIFADTFKEWGEELSPEDLSKTLLSLGWSDVVSVATSEKSKYIGASVAIFGSTSTVIDAMKDSITVTLNSRLSVDEEGEILEILGDSPAVYFAEIFVSREGRHISPLIFVNLIYTAMRTLINQGVSSNTRVVFFTKDRDSRGRVPAIYYFAKLLHMKEIPLPTINNQGRYAFTISLGTLSFFTSPLAAEKIIGMSRLLQSARRTIDKWINKDGEES